LQMAEGGKGANSPVLIKEWISIKKLSSFLLTVYYERYFWVIRKYVK
jgi:hypothetical protein